MSDNSSKSIINFILKKSKEIGLDYISFGSVERMEDYQKNELSNDKNLPTYYFPEAKSIISAGLSYNCGWNNISSNTKGFIAGYTTANFYKMLSQKLRILGTELKDYIAPNKSNKDFFRIFVNSKINDKLAAYISGLGCILKNSLISVNGNGPKFVIGELLVPIEIDYDNIRLNDCGNCTKCIMNCPTGALLPNGEINKEICIQHLSSQAEWPDKINNKDFIEYWGKRFFGCTDCIDICPKNKKNRVKFNNNESIGYIGTKFDPVKILEYTKSELQSKFSNNQLTASWIPTFVLARNALAAMYNLDKLDQIKKYLKNIGKYEWDNEEENILRKFCFFLINSK